MRNRIVALAAISPILAIQTASQGPWSPDRLHERASERHQSVILDARRIKNEYVGAVDECQQYYNLAMTSLDAGKLDEARRSFKDAITCDPNNPDSHLQLSELYYRSGYKTPTILAICRFLMLEPDSPRSQAALRRIALIMQKTAGKPLVGGGVSFDMDRTLRLDEGDFTTLDMALAMFGVRLAPKQSKDKIDSSSIIEELKLLLGALSQSKPATPSSGFAWDYYRPYFVEIKNRHYEEPFCYYISQSAKSGETSRWLAAYSRKVRDFRAWSEGYKWPTTSH